MRGFSVLLEVRWPSRGKKQRKLQLHADVWENVFVKRTSRMKMSSCVCFCIFCCYSSYLLILSPRSDYQFGLLLGIKLAKYKIKSNVIMQQPLEILHRQTFQLMDGVDAYSTYTHKYKQILTDYWHILLDLIWCGACENLIFNLKFNNWSNANNQLLSICLILR